MKRKGLLFVALLLLGVLSLCLFACDDTKDCNSDGTTLFHIHNFNKQEVKDTYLSKQATCEEKAEYFYSCSCGAVGTKTFEYGEVISCNYLEGVCERCSKPEPRSTKGLAFTLINNDLEYKVSGYNGSSTEVYIASTHNGKPVTSIGYEAFKYCDLTSVTIGNSVTSIGDYAFYYCGSLKSVTIGNSVTRIGSSAFYHCDYFLTSLIIPDSVTSIGSSAFSYCRVLTSVTIGNSVTSIGEEAFYHCDSLTSVIIPDSVTSIGHFAFEYCDSLTSVTIGNRVTSIGVGAFFSCDSLTSVTIGNSVTSIGESAFYSCNSLTSVTIPDSVTSIGEGAFSSCDSLTSVTFSDTSTWYITSDYNKWANKTGGTEFDVTDASNNAWNLDSTYYWYKI